MARFISAVGGTVSGKLGSSVFMKNGLIRQLNFGNKIPSTLQAAIWTAFGIISQAWSALTDAERNTWLAAVSGVLASAKALFQGNNTNRFLAGLTSLTNWVANATETDQATFLNGVVLGNTFVDVNVGGPYDFNGSTVPTGCAVAIMMTKPLKAGRLAFQESDYRLITVLPATTTTGTDISGNYAEVFPDVTIVANDVIGWKMKYIDTASGYSTFYVGNQTIAV